MTRLALILAAIVTGLAAAGCGGGSKPSASPANANAAAFAKGRSTLPGVATCMLGWNGRASASERARLTAGLDPANSSATMEQWPGAALRATTGPRAGGTVPVAPGDCVLANAQGAVFVAHDGGVWTAVGPQGPHDPLHNAVSDAQALPDATVSPQGYVASSTEPGP